MNNNLSLRKIKLFNQLINSDSLNFPKELTIELTNSCNLKCIMCPQKTAPKDWQKGKMSFTLFKKIIDECASENPNLCLTLHKDGESLLHPQLIEMIRYAKEKEIAYVLFHTNGLLLTEAKSMELLSSGLDKLVISINASNKISYSEITGVDSYEQLMNNIDCLIRLKKDLDSKVKIDVLIINQRDNVEEIDLFVEKWKPIVNKVVVNDFRNWAGVIEDKTSQEIPERFPCLNLWNHPAINFDGDMMVCCQTFGFIRDAIIGNIQNSQIKEIWQKSEKLRQARISHLSHKFDEVRFCKDCTSWKNYPDIWFLGATKVMRILGKSV